jgi:hypothetical protein
METTDTYRKLIKQLQEDKVIHHAYQMKQERAYITQPPTAQIIAELEEQAHKVRNILNVKHRTTKEPLFLFFIDLEPNENNKDIYDIKFVCNMKITVESPKQGNHIAHCTRCQSYGHTKTHCAKPYAFVKCGGNITQPHVQNHQIHQPNVHCAEETIPQATKVVKCTRICKKRGKPINQIAHRPTQQRINFSDNNPLL